MQLPKNTFAIDAHWSSSTGRQQATGGKKSSESLLVATSDGKLCCNIKYVNDIYHPKFNSFL